MSATENTTETVAFDASAVQPGTLLVGRNGKTYKAQSAAYDDVKGVARVAVKAFADGATKGPYRYMRQDSFASMVEVQS